MTAEELYAGIERENNRERHVCQEAKNASDYVCLCVHGKVSHLKSKDPVRRAAVSLVGRGMSVSGNFNFTDETMPAPITSCSCHTFQRAIGGGEAEILRESDKFPGG